MKRYGGKFFDGLIGWRFDKRQHFCAFLQDVLDFSLLIRYHVKVRKPIYKERRIMKRLVALLLGAVMVLSLVACGGKEESKSDLDYVKGNGKLIVGVTEYAPMDYRNEDGDWVGFDAELATKFAEYLGVDVEFFEITDWNQKANELNTKSIDCVWNGMTLTEEVKAAMSCKAYCNNRQVVVVKADKADEYTTEESVAGLTFAVEDGSAGEEQATDRDWDVTEVENQAATLLEVRTGASDAAIIDSLMAAVMVGEGTDYADLKATEIGLSDEELGVGFRKDSDLLGELEKFLEKVYADGTMAACAKKYGVLEADIIAQK